jgi:hypothetical protein
VYDKANAKVSTEQMHIATQKTKKINVNPAERVNRRKQEDLSRASNQK